jgi:two-component system sensor histidine kinase KdpD
MKDNGRILRLPVKTKFYQYLLVILIIGLTTLIFSPLSNPQSYHIVSFILLFVVAMLAVFMGIGPVLLASTISAISWNYFFIPPFHTFHITRTEDRLMFVSFFIIALLNGILTNRIRRQERLVRDREAQTNALFQLTEELSKASGIEMVLAVARNDFRKHFNADSRFVLQDDTKSGGLGLGLSIVKGLVESHNGTVSVENGLNGGARFTVAIPSDIPDMKDLKMVE